MRTSSAMRVLEMGRLIRVKHRDSRGLIELDPDRGIGKPPRSKVKRIE